MRPGQALKLLLAPPTWRLLAGSWRAVETGPPPPGPGPWIFACLHRDILPAIRHVRRHRPVLLVSNSPDGDILVRTLGDREYGFVRGASGEDGGRAFVLLKQALAGGRHVGIAVDGPKGPFGVVHAGVLRLARVTGAPIVPLRARAARARSLGTWDRTLVPWPGARVVVERGEAIALNAADSAETVAAAHRRLAGFLVAPEERA